MKTKMTPNKVKEEGVKEIPQLSLFTIFKLITFIVFIFSGVDIFRELFNIKTLGFFTIDTIALLVIGYINLIIGIYYLNKEIKEIYEKMR